MSRGISEADVWAASDALLLEGARPTIERVRQKIGRGSPNTVSPYLDTWFRSLGGRIKDPKSFSAPPEVPDPVQQAARQLWSVAQAESRREYALRLKEGMAAAVANVEAEKERASLAVAAAFEAASKATHLQAELVERTQSLERERLARATAEAHLDDARASRNDALAEVRRLADLLAEAQRVAEHAKGEAVAARELLMQLKAPATRSPPRGPTRKAGA